LPEGDEARGEDVFDDIRRIRISQVASVSRLSWRYNRFLLFVDRHGEQSQDTKFGYAKDVWKCVASKEQLISGLDEPRTKKKGLLNCEKDFFPRHCKKICPKSFFIVKTRLCLKSSQYKG
jgi:hypothetical protein